MTIAVALGALERARELVGQLDWDRKAEELDRVQAGLKHELETARNALSYSAPEGLVDLDAVANGYGLVRNDHPETAQEAAKEIKLRSGTQRAAVLLHLLEDHKAGMIGSSDELIAAVTGLGPSSERPRRVELVRMGLVEPSGKTIRTSTGYEAMMWRCTEQGVKAARKLEIQDPIPFEEDEEAARIAELFAEPSEVKPEDAQVPEVTGSPEDLAQVRHLVFGDPHADGATPLRRG